MKRGTGYWISLGGALVLTLLMWFGLFNVNAQIGHGSTSGGVLLHAMAAGSSCTAGAGHCILVSWLASPTAGVTYNLYRGTVPGGEGTTPYQSGITSLNFTDGNLTPGQYCYKATASLGGVESTFTNEACSTIQTPPQPPGTLSTVVE